jgi:hypothetical protein
MSEGFTKLFGSLIHSTIWREKDHVRLVWITMLAMVNRDGIVEASLPGLADAARVTIEQCEDALSKFHAPDKYSRSKAHDGRRVGTVDGGWHLLNHEDYRRRMSIEDQREKTAERVRRHRGKDREFTASVTGEALHDVTETAGNESNDIAEAEADTKAEAEKIRRATVPATPAPKSKPERKKPRHSLPEDWRPTPEHLERARTMNLNCRVEFDKFQSHAVATGRLMANWNAAFTTWLLNAEGFARAGGRRAPAAPRQPNSGYSPSAHAREIT